jgi:hypothetical protein
MAIRRTWLKALPESLDADTVAARFFIGLPLTSSTSTAAAPSPVGAAGAEVKEDDPQQLAVAAEALEFGDVALLNLADRYMATPMKVVSLFKWGVQQCGAWWVLRANDDVYLRLPETMRVLASHPPANVVAGLFLDGANMHVPRPEHYGSTQVLINNPYLTYSKAIVLILALDPTNTWLLPHCRHALELYAVSLIS